MTNMITTPITSLSQNTFEKLISFKPVINEKSLSVMMINKHLNNSDTVKNIRNAYNQKKLEEGKLSEGHKARYVFSWQWPYESGNDEYTFLVKKEKHNEVVIFINNESGYIDVLLKGVDKNGFDKTIYHAKNGYHRFKLDVGFTYKVVFTKIRHKLITSPSTNQ
jgi:hypothetical protein